MGVRLSFDGMDEFREGLRNLPQALASQAAQVVQGSAEQAGQAIRSNYPIRQTNLHPGPRRKSPWYPPGNLHNRVTVTNQSSGVSARYVVKSSAPHAHLFENGTGRRSTQSGANRGSMPAAPIGERMIPVVIRVRARMVSQLVEIVKAAGFTVGES